MRQESLQVSLLSSSCDVRQCGKYKNSTGIDVSNMVVMDQRFGVFKVVLNSGLSADIPHEELHVGSTIIIVDWSIIWHTDAEEGWKRGVLFISNFDWGPAPHDTPKINDRANSTVSLDFCKAWVDSKAIEKVKKESVMLFLESFQHDDGFFYWVEMTPRRLCQGKFLPALEDQSVWQRGYQKRSADFDEEACPCCKAPHYFV